jgi:hypothetical protein
MGFGTKAILAAILLQSESLGVVAVQGEQSEQD